MLSSTNTHTAPPTTPMPQQAQASVSQKSIASFMPFTTPENVLPFRDGNLGIFSDLKEGSVLQVINPRTANPVVEKLHLFNELKITHAFELKEKKLVCFAEHNNTFALYLFVENNSALRQQKLARCSNHVVHMDIIEHQGLEKILLVTRISEFMYNFAIYDNELRLIDANAFISSKPIKKINVMSNGNIFIQSDQLHRWQMDLKQPLEQLDTSAIGSDCGIPLLCSDGKWIFTVQTDYSEIMQSHRAATWHICELQGTSFISRDVRHASPLRGEAKHLSKFSTPSCDYILTWDKGTGNCNIIKREENKLTAPFKDIHLEKDLDLMVTSNHDIFTLNLTGGTFSCFQLPDCILNNGAKLSHTNNPCTFFSAPNELPNTTPSRQYLPSTVVVTGLDPMAKYTDCVASLKEGKLALIEVHNHQESILRVINMAAKQPNVCASYSLGARRVKAVLELNQPVHKTVFVVQEYLDDNCSDKLYLMTDHPEDIFRREKTFSYRCSGWSISNVKVKQDAKEDRIVVNLVKNDNKAELKQDGFDSSLNETQARVIGDQQLGLIKDGKDLHRLPALNGINEGEDYIFIYYRKLQQWNLLCKIASSNTYQCKLRGEITLSENDVIYPATNGDIYIVNVTPPLKIQHLPLGKFLLEPLLEHFESLDIIPVIGKIITSYMRA